VILLGGFFFNQKGGAAKNCYLKSLDIWRRKFRSWWYRQIYEI